MIVDSYIKNNPDALNIEHGVSGDFKTAARSKKDRLGMVDLLGYEPEPTKSQKQRLHEANLTNVDTCISFVESLMSRANNLACLSSLSKSDLMRKLIDILGMIARIIPKLRLFIGVKEHTTTRAIDRVKRWSGSS